MRRGQALVELAVCVPAILLLALGATATVQVFDARSGLEAATRAAAAEAARAAGPASAQTEAQARFASMIAAYPVGSPHLVLTYGGFARGDEVRATGSGTVDISWAALVFPPSLTLESGCVVPVEPWRSHRL